MNAAVFLDRDNTIIHNDGDLGDPDLVRLIQGAASAIASLRGLNYKIIVITNQGGVARGKYGEEDVEKTNQRVADLVKAASGANIDRFYYCPYHPNGSVPEYTCEHEWRKPQPGMLLQAAKDMNIDLSKSWMVGDQMRDVQAGVAAGTRCILLRADAQEVPPLRGDQLKAGHVETTGDISHFTAHNMVEAVRIIAKQRKPEAEQIGEPTRKKWDPAAAQAAREALNPSAESTSRQQQSKDTSSSDAGLGVQANQPPAASNPSAKTPRTASKPFKPWGAKDSHGSSSSMDSTSTYAAGSGATPKAKPIASEPPAEVEEDEVPIAADISDPNLEPHEIQAMVEDDELQQETTQVGSAVTTASTSHASAAAAHAGQNPAAGGEQTKVTIINEPVADESADSSSGKPGTRSRTPSSDVTLRQILQELRGQRTVQNDFSYVRMIAIVLQIVTVFLLIAGLLLGSTDVEIFLRWIATAILVQLAAIALILLER